MTGRALAILLLLCVAIAGYAQQVKEQRMGGRKAATSQELFGHFWSLEPGWQTELEMRNLQAIPLEVTPVIRTASGAEIPLPTVELQADEVRTIDLGAQIQNAAPHLLAKADSYGSLVLRFNALDRMNLYAAVMLRQPGQPISYHFDAAFYPAKIGSGTRETIWWLPRPEVDGDLVITNFSSMPRTARLLFFDHVGRSKAVRVALGPRQTDRLKLRHAVAKTGFSSQYGGIRLISDDVDDGALQLSQFVYDQTTGFSAHMKVLSRGSGARVGPQITRAPMMALSVPDPALGFPDTVLLHPLVFVRNIAETPITAELSVNWLTAGSSGRVSTELLPIAAGETRLVDLSAFQKNGSVPAEAHWATVSLAYYGRRGDLIPIAASYEQTGRYGLQTPFSPSVSFGWKGGMWHVSDTHNSLITAGNGDTEPTTVAFGLRYDRGKELYELPDRELKAGEQMLVDVGHLIRNQVPDKTGRVLPIDLQHGSYEFRELANKAVGHLYEGKLVIDKTYGHATYGCGCCCSIDYAWIDPWFLFAPGETGQATVYGDNNCYGLMNITSSAYGWFTANSSIGTVSSSGLETAVAPGTTSVSSFVQVTRPVPEAGYCECMQEELSQGGGMDVKGVVEIGQTSASPGVIKYSTPHCTTVTVQVSVLRPSPTDHPTVTVGLQQLSSTPQGIEVSVSPSTQNAQITSSGPHNFQFQVCTGTGGVGSVEVRSTILQATPDTKFSVTQGTDSARKAQIGVEN